MRKLFLGFVLAAFVPTGAEAATWYVARTGNDGSTCTQAQSPGTPKLTINAALACVGFSLGAGADHIVQVANGIYPETITRWPSGTSGRPFVLKSASPRGAIIRPQSISTHIVSFSSGYVTVDGFVVDGINVSANNIVLNSGTTDITIQNCEIKNTQKGDGTGTGSWQAVYAYNTGNAKFLNNEIHDIGVGATAHFNHGIYWSASNSLFEGNRIYNVGGFAIKIWSAWGNTMTNNIVRNNILYNFAMGGTGDGIRASGSNNLVYNNVIYQTGNNPNAVGIALEGSANEAHNNTIYNNGYFGIALVGTGSVARNNIVFQNGTNFYITESNYVVDHNLTTDPKFVAPTTFDFRLQAESPAIDAALTVSRVSTDVTGVPRPQGGAYDIGAFEYPNASGSLPAAPTNVRIGAQ